MIFGDLYREHFWDGAVIYRRSLKADCLGVQSRAAERQLHRLSGIRGSPQPAQSIGDRRLQWFMGAGFSRRSAQ
jgi:hypothetical protein